MLDKRSGKIINIGSNAGMLGLVEHVSYSAAKGGVIAFTKALAKEVCTFGINVNCVCPGGVQTDAMLRFSEDGLEALKKATGLGRLGTPEDIANAVAFLASDEANYITGQNIPVMGIRNLGN